jgi:tripartite-type tricarboxylate transporter receptor subunit TctC
MPQALTDLIGGQVDTVFAGTSSAMGMLHDGMLRAVAVTSAKRLGSLPDVPTVAESGLPGYELAAWVGVFVRAGTPPDIVTKLNELVTKWVSDPETEKYMETVGATPFPSTPEQLGAFAEADTKRWAEIVSIAKMEKK